jgi:hypothetical protein
MRSAQRLIPAGLALACVLAPVAASAASALDLYYERTLMSAAHARCGLFAPTIAAALDASARQARGAALRAGETEGRVREIAVRAQGRAQGVGCASADLKTAAARVRSAFDGWSRTARMNFPGESATWTADRAAYSSANWRLSQPGSIGTVPVTFGVIGQEDGTALVAVARFAGGEQPYAARLVFRDTARAHAPWLGAPANRPLPPRSASRIVIAQKIALAGPTIAPKDAKKKPMDDAVAIRFPADTAALLGALDPRERFAVEFVFRDETVKTARFEVGDFAAGQAFLKLGRL